MTEMKCFECGHTGMDEKTENVEYLSLPGTILQGVSVYYCRHCDGKEIAIPHINRLNRLLIKFLESKVALTKDEATFLRKAGREPEAPIITAGQPMCVVQPAWNPKQRKWYLIMMDNPA